MSELLFLRARLRRRDHWDARRIANYQERALGDLRRAAYASSEFYRRHHAGLLDAPLAQLPPVTKADLMNNFDRTVTVPGLKLAELEDHLRVLMSTGADPGLSWRKRWWTAATAGTTGRRGTFVWDRTEWATVLASYARANDWAGVPAGLTHPLRVGMVSSRVPTHQSAVVGASLRSRLVPTLRLDATDPLSETVAALNKVPTTPVGRLSIYPQAPGLPGIKGQVSIHPNVFHTVLDDASIAGWQVIQEPSALRVLLVGLAPSASIEVAHDRVVAALPSAGVVGTQVNVHVVESVERTPLGKAPPVPALKVRP